MDTELEVTGYLHLCCGVAVVCPDIGLDFSIKLWSFPAEVHPPSYFTSFWFLFNFQLDSCVCGLRC